MTVLSWAAVALCVWAWAKVREVWLLVWALLFLAVAILPTTGVIA